MRKAAFANQRAAPALALVLALALAPVLALASGCAGGAASPCSPEACGAGERCVVGRCRPNGKPVVDEASRRVVLLARDVAVLSTKDVPTDAAVTSLGASASGDVTILMRFDSGFSSKATLAGAFLVIDPDREVPGPTRAVDVDVVEVLGDWSSRTSSVGRTPSLSLPIAHASIAPARRAPLRVDVTEAVARSRGTGHGFAIVASGDDPIGAAVVSAAGDSAGPRLELYLK